MAPKKEALAPVRDPFTLLRRMTGEFDRMFEEGAWPMIRWPRPRQEAASWFPEIDVFEKGGRLVTQIDLPGMKKEDVKVEVTDGQLTISGERKSEAEEKKEDFYRCEREYGSFYRTVPLPAGVKLEDIKAVFTDGVLEVSVPMPVAAKPKAHKVEIKEAEKRELTHA